jgi:hypothetical protein
VRSHRMPRGRKRGFRRTRNRPRHRYWSNLEDGSVEKEMSREGGGYADASVAGHATEVPRETVILRVVI